MFRSRRSKKGGCAGGAFWVLLGCFWGAFRVLLGCVSLSGASALLHAKSVKQKQLQGVARLYDAPLPPLGRARRMVQAYTWPGSIWRPSACGADVIATRPQVLLQLQKQINLSNKHPWSRRYDASPTCMPTVANSLLPDALVSRSRTQAPAV